MAVSNFFSLEQTDDRIHTWKSAQSHYAAGVRKVFHILHTGVSKTKTSISVCHPWQMCVLSLTKVQLYTNRYPGLIFEMHWACRAAVNWHRWCCSKFIPVTNALEFFSWIKLCFTWTLILYSFFNEYSIILYFLGGLGSMQILAGLSWWLSLGGLEHFLFILFSPDHYLTKGDTWKENF